MSVIRVFLVDDHGMMRQGLRSILQQEEDIVVIGEANSGEALLHQIENGVFPDVVLMDVYLGGISGIEATQRLKHLRPQVHVIGLSAADADHSILAMLEAGACGYLSKASSASELAKMIRAAYAKELKLIPLPHASTSATNKQPVVHPLAVANVPTLTKLQLSVLKLLIQGYSTRKIAQRLLLSEDSIQLQLSYIFAALGVTSPMEAVAAATCVDRLAYSEPHLLTFPDIELNEDYREVKVRGHLVDLTPTEYQVLYLLMSLPNQPVSKQELLQHIWHSDFDRSTNLIEVVIRRLRAKIELDPANPTYILTVWKFGYKFNTKSETCRVTKPTMSKRYKHLTVGERASQERVLPD